MNETGGGMSFDARDWAKLFVGMVQNNPAIATDEECMTTWFANALMRGYDEREWRTPEYKRRMRRILNPWWSWKHWFAAALLLSTLLLCGCLNRAQRVQRYQDRATKACEAHHTPAECKVLPYPSEER